MAVTADGLRGRPRARRGLQVLGLAVLLILLLAGTGLTAGRVFAGTLTDTNKPPLGTVTPMATPTCPPIADPLPVGIVEYAFQPDPITIYQGTLIYWFNRGSTQHTTTSDTGAWDSGVLNPNQSFSHTFNTVGTFTYHCTIHPTQMTGTITVLQGCPRPTTETPVPTYTPTSTLTGSSTPTLTFTFTPLPTFTPTSTLTGSVTPTSTSTPPAGIINGHLTWQGINQPSSRNTLVTGTLTLCVSGSPESFSFTTNTSGNFTITTGLPDGTYNWLVQGGRHITTASPANGAALVIHGGSATQEFGIQRSGNVNPQTDNIINVTDYNVVKAHFGQSGVSSADFDYNLVVNATDFGNLKGNFGQAGHDLTCP